MTTKTIHKPDCKRIFNHKETQMTNADTKHTPTPWREGDEEISGRLG